MTPEDFCTELLRFTRERFPWAKRLREPFELHFVSNLPKEVNGVTSHGFGHGAPIVTLSTAWINDPYKLGALFLHELAHVAHGPDFGIEARMTGGHTAKWRYIATLFGLVDPMDNRIVGYGPWALREPVRSFIASLGPMDPLTEPPLRLADSNPILLDYYRSQGRV